MTKITLSQPSKGSEAEKAEALFSPTEKECSIAEEKAAPKLTAEEKSERSSREMRLIYKSMKSVEYCVKKKTSQTDKMVKQIATQLEQLEILMGEIQRTHEFVGEMMSNCIAAIKQHECYIAWYPAQNGQEEQRVIGKYVRIPKEKQKELEGYLNSLAT